MGVHGLAWCRVSVRTQHRVRPRAGLRETPSSEAEGHGGAGGPRVGGAAPVSRCVSAPLREGEGRGERPCGGSGRWLRVGAAVLARGGAGRLARVRRAGRGCLVAAAAGVGARLAGGEVFGSHAGGVLEGDKVGRGVSGALGAAAWALAS